MSYDNLTAFISKSDRDKCEEAIRTILHIFDDPARDGLRDTPRRVTNMLCELLAGQFSDNDRIAEMFDVQFVEKGCKDLVLMQDIECFSMCEHHMALMYNMKIHVAYIPDERVLGLSKIARIADLVCRRLQLQEKICRDIADIMETITQSHDVMVIAEGSHSCMTARGIKRPGTVTKCAVVRGLFAVNANLRAEVYSMLAQGRGQ